jgi:ABC-type amino acid transport substrate-binding protein
MMNMVREGELDIVLPVVRTPVREKFLHFTIPFYHTTLYAFVHRNSGMQITDVKELLMYKRVEIRNSSVGTKMDALLKDTTPLLIYHEALSKIERVS